MVEFIEGLERLKYQTRHAWTATGRQESIADHSWRVAMFALVLAPELPHIDMHKVVRILLVHDLGEALEGDVSAKLETASNDEKLRREEAALGELTKPLSAAARSIILDLWREYNDGATPEAKAAKALDKIETIIQHNQGRNPADFDHAFNLGYGAGLADVEPVLARIREEVDRDTSRNAAK
jgi:putative hydrolase of HD superfamily